MTDEKVINIVYVENSLLITLTSNGRLFQRHFDGAGYGDWYEMDLPDLKKSKPRTQAKESAYSEDFNDFWSMYPKDHGGSKKEAYRQYQARIKDQQKFAEWQKPEHEFMMAGVRRYAGFIKATDQFVMHPAKFLGRDKHYLNDFTIPKQVIKKNGLKLPFDDNELEKFAKHNKLPSPGKMETYSQYRAKLQAEINRLNEV